MKICSSPASGPRERGRPMAKAMFRLVERDRAVDCGHAAAPPGRTSAQATRLEHARIPGSFGQKKGQPRTAAP